MLNDKADDWRLDGKDEDALSGLTARRLHWHASDMVVFNNGDSKISRKLAYGESVPSTNGNVEIVEDGWDHEHCYFCWKKIVEDDIAYCLDSNPEHWICETCFDDFKDRFGW